MPGPARFLDPEVLARIGSLELLARAVVEGFISGLHRSPLHRLLDRVHGVSPVQPGDDLRYLDWRLLGRTDRYFIKKYRADTNAQCHLLVDTSASMRYQSGAASRSSSTRSFSPPRSRTSSRDSRTRSGSCLRRAGAHARPGAQPHRPHADHLRPALDARSGRRDAIATALHETAERLTRRGIVVLISDFYDEPEELADAFQHLRFKGTT